MKTKNTQEISKVFDEKVTENHCIQNSSEIMYLCTEINHRSMEDSEVHCHSSVSQWHAENSHIHGGSYYNGIDCVLREQNMNEKVDINIDNNTDREMDESPNISSNPNDFSLDSRVKCFVCGELVEKQKLSGHLLFGELKCSHCLLEVKTCEQFQAVKHGQTTLQHKMNPCQHKVTSGMNNQGSCQHNQMSCQYNHTSSHHCQTSCHHNQDFCQHNMTNFQHNQNLCQNRMSSCQHNQSSCQHKDFTWPISPTPMDFLKDNLSNERGDVNVEVCCYIAKLSVLASAKPWKGVIQSYWSTKESSSCSDCQRPKRNSALKTILSRPFKPNIHKHKNHNTKNRKDLDKKCKNQVTTDIITSLNCSKSPLLESQKREKYSLLKFILNQPVRYNFDIINNNNASMKCNIQDNEVSSSQTQQQLLTTNQCSIAV